MRAGCPRFALGSNRPGGSYPPAWSQREARLGDVLLITTPPCLRNGCRRLPQSCLAQPVPSYPEAPFGADWPRDQTGSAPRARNGGAAARAWSGLRASALQRSSLRPLPSLRRISRLPDLGAARRQDDRLRRCAVAVGEEADGAAGPNIGAQHRAGAVDWKRHGSPDLKAIISALKMLVPSAPPPSPCSGSSWVLASFRYSTRAMKWRSRSIENSVVPCSTSRLKNSPISHGKIVR